jgi:hypothetical protein
MTKYNETDDKSVLEPTDDAVASAWGKGWRMPTTEEYAALGNAVNTAWTQVEGVYGMLCTDKTDSSLNTIDTTEIMSDYINDTNKNMIIITEKINITKENLKNELPSIIRNIEKGHIYEKKGEDYTILIYPLNANSPDLTSKTHVNFTNCENKLRKYYNISDSVILTFLQIEIENVDSKSLINQVEYQAYDGNTTLLNLSICDDVNINMTYAIKNSSYSLIDFESANNFKKLGIDIFNINDSFFNDICQPYSESDDDLILEDRIKEYYQNYSLCEQDCTYKGIDFEYMTITCECNVKDNVSTVMKPINVENAEGSSTNFEVVKCYNLVFSFKDKDKNYGFIIFSVIFLAHLPLLFYYFIIGIKPVKEYIIKEMKKYGYIKNIKNQIKKKNKIKII